jgi:hypothetical protein
MSKERRSSRSQGTRSNERDRAPKKGAPSDGIFLEGNGSNWELFERLYKENARRTFGRLIDELDMDEDIVMPIEEPNGDPNSFEYKIAFERIKITAKILAEMEEARFRLFGDIMTHISLQSENRVRLHADFGEANREQSPRMLWTIVRTTHIANQHAGDLGMWFGRGDLYALRQGSMNIEDYCVKFKTEYDKLIAMGDDITEVAATRAFITSINGKTYAEEVARWAGAGEVPDNLDEAIRKVNTWVTTVRNARKSMSGGEEGHHETGFKARVEGDHETGFEASAEGDRETAAAAGGGKADNPKNCPICKKRSKHAIEDCWELEKFCQQARDKKSGSPAKDGNQVKVDTAQKGGKNPSWMIRVGMAAGASEFQGVYLDTGATISLWDSRAELTRTYKVPEVSILGINGESTSTTGGEHPIWGKVVVLQDCPYKLISIRQLRQEGFYVEYHHGYDSFKVTSSRLGLKFYFDAQDGGLYQLRDDGGELARDTDTVHHAKAGPEGIQDDASSVAPLAPVEATHLPVRTEQEILETEESPKNTTYTKFERRAAQVAREACKALGHVGKEALIRAIKSGANFNVSVQDVHRAETILGPCPGCKHGKITSTNRGYTRPEIEDVPELVAPDHHQEILHADLFYMPAASKTLHIVVMSVGQRHRLIVLSKIANKTKQDMIAAWEHHLSIYKRNDFKIREIHTDNEVNLSSTRDELGHRNVKLIQAASQTHEKYCERRIRVVKERMRSVLSDLPFETPRRLYYRLALWVVQGINCVPDTLCDAADIRSARERVTGRKTDMKTMTKYFFGQSVLYHIANNDAANTAPRAGTGIVVARDLDSGNFLVFNPSTDSTVARKSLTPLPITGELISSLNEMARQDEGAQEDEGMTRLTATDSILP